MKNIYIVGAGQLGSRHLQALKAVKTPLEIKVIDPSKESLKVAKERFEAIKGVNHPAIYLAKIKPDLVPIDLAIIATSADVRKNVIENLLRASKVKYFILEKLLFNRKNNYAAIGKLLKRKGSKAWVNCSMRSMPFYFNLKKETDSKIHYSVTGSQFGLVTNLIHYLDHMAFLSDEIEYTVDTSGLDKKVIPSKRKGFLELTGTLNVFFKNGSSGSFTCFSEGDLPVVVEIASKNYHFISRESEEKAWVARSKDKWKWREAKAIIPFQSERTTEIVDNILKNGACVLPSCEVASRLHLPVLEALLSFINKNSSKRFNYYPFT